MKAFMKLMIVVTLSLITVSVIGAEMAKEGTGQGVTYFTGTSQVHAQGEENFVINYEARGVSDVDDETSPFYMTSSLCVGSSKAMKGAFKESGLCTMTRTDGDQIYMSYEADGKMGSPVKGTYTLLGGTGKCTGITGTGEFVRTYLKGPAKGISASFAKSKGDWKIP